jgi:hypothetical protein
VKGTGRRKHSARFWVFYADSLRQSPVTAAQKKYFATILQNATKFGKIPVGKIINIFA